MYVFTLKLVTREEASLFGQAASVCASRKQQRLLRITRVRSVPNLCGDI